MRVYRLGCATDIKEMYTQECDDETAEERDGSDSVCRVETLKEDEGCDNRRCRETDIIHRIYARHIVQVSTPDSDK